MENPRKLGKKVKGKMICFFNSKQIHVKWQLEKIFFSNLFLVRLITIEILKLKCALREVFKPTQKFQDLVNIYSNRSKERSLHTHN